MNKDIVAGKVKETGGKARRKVGKTLRDEEGETLGAKDQVTGNIQKNFGKMRDMLD